MKKAIVTSYSKFCPCAVIANFIGIDRLTTDLVATYGCMNALCYVDLINIFYNSLCM